MFDPKIGRFDGEDPLRFSGGDVDLYRYVRNSPTNGTDPKGLDIQGNSGPERAEARRQCLEDWFERVSKENGLDPDTARKILKIIRETPIPPEDANNKWNPCERWTNAVYKKLQEALELTPQGFIKGTKVQVNINAWTYKPTLGNLFCLFVNGHFAIEVKFPDRRIIFLDDGNWGHIFEPERIPSYAK